MRTGYTGHDGIARSVQKIYLGINNKAKRCVRAYAGVNGRAKLIYPVDQPIPTVSGVFTYDRDVHEAIISEYDDDMIAVSGVTKTTNAGTYTITFTLKSPMYRWLDGTNTPKTGTWTINKKVLSIPYIIPGSYSYTGNLQSASISEHDPYGVSISGEPTAIDAGNHVVRFNLSSTNNYIWSDGTSEEKTDSWTINPLLVAVPTVTGAYTFNNKAQTAIVNYAEGTSGLINESGVKTATNAGSYAVFFDLKDTINYRWADNTIEQKRGNWAIAKAALVVPTLSASSKQYSGNEQSVTVSGFDKNTMTQSGTLAATAVGSYNVRFDLIYPTNYKWSTGDESVGYRIVSWAIVKKPVTIPTVSANPTYNGGELSPTLANYSASTVRQSGDTKKIAAGNYTIKFDLVDSANYTWTDGTTSQKSAAWSIAKRTVTIPTVTANPTYSGSEVSPTLANYNSSMVVLSGNKQTNVGNYTIKFNLIDGSNNKWTDGSITEKTASWYISKKSVAVPSVTNTSFTYNGAEQAPTVSRYDSNVIYEPSNSVKKATNAGTYYVRFNLMDTANYQWSDGTTAQKTAAWSIGRASVAKPTISGSYTYTGSAQTVSISGYDSNKMTVSGATYTAAGSYTVRFNVKGNWKWSDESTSEVAYNWSIAVRRVPVPTLSWTSKYWNGNTLTPTISSTAYITVGGTRSASAVGSYNITFKVDGSNVTWTDGTYGQKSASWSILKTNITLEIVDYDGRVGAVIIAKNQSSEVVSVPCSVRWYNDWYGGEGNGTTTFYYYHYMATVGSSRIHMTATVNGSANYNSSSASVSYYP